MERERVRDSEAKEDNFYEKVIRDRAQWVDRQMKGKLLIRGDEREYQETRQGRLKNYISPHIGDTALNNWSCFIHDIRRQSGRHRHQGGIIIYVIEGEGVTEVDGKMLNWKAGDLLLLPIAPKGVAHQHFNGDDSRKCRWIAFRHHAIRDYTVNSITQLEESPDYQGDLKKIKSILKGEGQADTWKAKVHGEQVSLVTDPDELHSVNLFDKLLEMRDHTRKRHEKATWLIRGEELAWELNQHGKMQWYLHPCIAYTVLQTYLFFRQEIPVGSRSGLQRHGGDMIFFILQGEGYTEVDGVKHEWKAEDVMTLPLRPDGVAYRHVNTGKEPVRMIGIEPNLIHTVGLDRHSGFEQLQPCPEYRQQRKEGAF